MAVNDRERFKSVPTFGLRGRIPCRDVSGMFLLAFI